MRDIRIHVPAALAAGAHIALPDAAAGHVARVLRLRAGDPVVLFNGDGHEYPARLIQVDARAAVVEIAGSRTANRESPLAITLVQALARGEKMDWIVQKATELGVHAIVPVTSERSEVQLGDARGAKRLDHWRAVTVSACEQCGRNVVPRIDAPRSLQAWLQGGQAHAAALRLALLPNATARNRDLQVPAGTIVLAVGPEGGFGARDEAQLHAAGFSALRLGPRILRTETAGLAALAMLQALYGDA